MIVGFQSEISVIPMHNDMLDFLTSIAFIGTSATNRRAYSRWRGTTDCNSPNSMASC